MGIATETRIVGDSRAIPMAWAPPSEVPPSRPSISGSLRLCPAVPLPSCGASPYSAAGGPPLAFASASRLADRSASVGAT
jgi:hypothetical protein